MRQKQQLPVPTARPFHAAVRLVIACLAAVLLFEACVQTAASDKTAFQKEARNGQKGITIASWNIQNFGGSKSDEEIAVMAAQIKDFDVVAVQEVVTAPAGAQAVGRLGEALSRTGSKWDYTISDPTTSQGGGSERYAFLWKTARVTKVGRAWLDQHFEREIDREPYCITLRTGAGKEFTMVSFHAVPKTKQPETEIRYFKELPAKYPGKTLIFCGDFNCPQSHSVFNPLKEMGYKPTLVKQRTTLRQECKEDGCLASEYDNIFCSDAVRKLRSGIVPFYEGRASMKEARQISDHVPVYLQMELR